MKVKILFGLIINLSFFNSNFFPQSDIISPKHYINSTNQNLNMESFWLNNFRSNKTTNEKQTLSTLDSIYMITLGGTLSKVQFFYNEQNKLTSYVNSDWDGDKWIIRWRVTNSYNTEGKIKTFLLEYFWNIWEPDTKESYNYNSLGQEVGYLIENWNGAEWTNYLKVTEQYDSTGNVIEEIDEKWVDTSWNYFSRITKKYSDKNILASALFETWDNNKWNITSKSDFEYDSYKNMVNSSAKKWNGSEWINYARVSFFYDLNNNRTEETSEMWTDSNWIYYERILNLYNENKSKVHSKYFMWDNGIWQSTNGPIVFTLPEDITMGFITNEINFYYSPTTNVKQDRRSNESGYSLFQNYPNPFNPITKICYQIPSANFVSLKVYDLLGNEVATLVNEYKQSGSYEIEFNTSKSGITSSLPSGIYFYQLKAKDYIETKKFILLK